MENCQTMTENVKYAIKYYGLLLYSPYIKYYIILYIIFISIVIILKITFK